MDSIACGYVCQPLTSIAALDGFGTLERRELGFATKLHAGSHGALSTGASALPDQLALELGNRGQ
jgi:hypothetical protein